PRALGVLTDAWGSRFRHDPAFLLLGDPDSRRGPFALLHGCAHRYDELVEIAGRHALQCRTPPQHRARLQQCMVDLPGVRTPGQLQDGLDQLVLEWVEVPVRHALAAVAYVQRQQVARLDLVADPPAGLARHLGKRRDGKVRSEERRVGKEWRSGWSPSP